MTPTSPVQSDPVAGRAVSFSCNVLAVNVPIGTAQKALICASSSIVALGLFARFYLIIFGTHTPLREMGPFIMDHEQSIPTWYSTLLLMVCAILLSIIVLGSRAAGRPFVLGWIGLALTFVALSAEEIAGLHEVSAHLLRARYDLPSYLYFAWVIPAIVLLVLFAALYFKFLMNLPVRYLVLFLVSGAIYVAGAVGMEMVGGYLIVNYGRDSSLFALETVTEETLEIAGATLFAWSLLDYIKAMFGSASVMLVGENRR